MLRDDLCKYLNNLLQPSNYRDYCPNGLQIEGKHLVQKVACGVSLNQTLIDYAIANSVDTIVVHHGIFWNKSSYPIVGIKHKRISALIKHDINLIAYHLPLDCHPSLGNNAQLAQLLQLNTEGQTGDQNLIWYGTLAQQTRAIEFQKFYNEKTGHQSLLQGNYDQIINRIAWCTGGADSLFEEAIALGVDCFISGEISEPIKSLAEESGVAYLAGGHYVTERYGIKALCNHLQEIGINSQFVEIYNQV